MATGSHRGGKRQMCEQIEEEPDTLARHLSQQIGHAPETIRYAIRMNHYVVMGSQSSDKIKK